MRASALSVVLCLILLGCGRRMSLDDEAKMSAFLERVALGELAERKGMPLEVLCFWLDAYRIDNKKWPNDVQELRSFYGDALGPKSAATLERMRTAELIAQTDGSLLIRTGERGTVLHRQDCK